MKWWLRILAALALVALLVHAWPAGAQRDDVRGALLAVRLRAQAVPIWAWLILGWLWTASYLLRAERLYVEWHSRVGLGRAACLRLVLRHYALVNLLPMRAGEATLPVLLHRERKVPVADAAASLLWWRWQDVVVLGTLACLLLLPLLGAPWVMAGVCLCVLATVMGGPILRRLEACAARRWPSLARWFRAAARPAQMRSTWAWCALGWAAKIVALGLAMGMLSGTGWREGLLGALGGEWGAAWPVQPFAGFGSYELSAWGTVRLWFPSVSALDLMAAALFLHVVTLVLSTVMGAMACWAVPASGVPTAVARPLELRADVGASS